METRRRAGFFFFLSFYFSGGGGIAPWRRLLGGWGGDWWERLAGGWWGLAVAQSPLRDAFTFRVAAGVEWGAMERARAQWRGHLGTLKLL